MVRKILAIALCGALGALFGCAAQKSESRTPDWQPRLDDVSRSQTRLEMRVDEVTRSLLALRDRIEAQEAALKQAREEKENLEEPAGPPLEVVKVEPLPKEPTKPEAVVSPPASAKGEGRAVAEGTEARPQPPAARVGADRTTPPADLYRRAYSAFRGGRFGQAILDFEEFVRKYPDHDYADNAQYWIGECYYSQREFGEAVVEFGRVLERYPREEKAPDALLKIGLSFQQLGEMEKARSFWKRTASEFPGSEAAMQARRFLVTSP